MVMNGSPSEAELNAAMQHLRFNSVLRRHDMMGTDKANGIINHTLKMLVWMAVSEEGNSDWIVRHLHPGDLPPTTTTAREWQEVTGTTSETFVTAALGDGTSIADDTFIGIYGCQWLWAPVRNGPIQFRSPWRPPVTFVRFTVGGTRVAEWDLYTIWKTHAHQGPSSTVTEKLGSEMNFPVGIGESPILIAQNKSLLIQYYEQVPTTATTFGLMFHGFVVEKRGAGDGLNP